MTAPEARGRRRLDDLARRGDGLGIQYVVVDAREVRFQYEGGRADLASGRPARTSRIGFSAR